MAQKGKRGPRPEEKERKQKPKTKVITPQETKEQKPETKGAEPETTDDPSETMPPITDTEAQTVNGTVEHREPLRPQNYSCDDCSFSGTFEEWNEHSGATSHREYTRENIEPEQPALFEMTA